MTLNKDGYDFYEVKFTDSPITDSIVKEEKEQVDNAPIEYNRMGFFSKSGFKIKNSQNIILYTLKELYKYNPEEGKITSAKVTIQNLSDKIG